MQQIQPGPVSYTGFPVRSLTKKLDGNGGKWITAYRVEQKKRFKTTISHPVSDNNTSSRVLRPPTNTREVSGTHSLMRPSLNAKYLCSKCYVDEPGDLCVADISGADLDNFSPKDLSLFTNLVHINAADNKLPLDTFVHFPCLEGLELPLNGLVDVGLNPGDLSSLTTLDLSYNSLSGAAVVGLGLLSALRELHLTGNNLVALPVDMTRPYRQRMRFPVLEKLWLDDNKLSDQTTFAILAGLRRLQYLNLDNNEIYFVPQLKLLGARELKSQLTQDTPGPSTEQSTPSGPTALEQAGKLGDLEHRVKKLAVEGTASDSESKSEVLLRELSVNDEEMRCKSSDNGRSLNPDQIIEFKSIDRSNTVSPGASDCVLKSPSPVNEAQAGVMDTVPFPELKTLSLVNNLLMSPEGLVPCESWPALNKLLIYNNPITATYKGMPPLLKERLVEGLGIRVYRKKPSTAHRHLIGSKVKDFKKVSSEAPPPIPKWTLPAIECPPMDTQLSIGYTASIGDSSPRDSVNSLGSLLEDSTAQESGDESDGVFLTQVAGEDPEPCQEDISQESTERDDYKARLDEVQEKFNQVPDRYKGFEILLDTYDDPHNKIPTDVQSCVRALKYALKHPVSLNPQPPASIASSSTSSTNSQTNYLRKKTPPLGSLPVQGASGTARNIQQVLNEIRSQCNDMETNLSLALSPRSPTQHRTTTQLQKESKQLLAQMQACYDRVRATSLDTVQSALDSRPATVTRPVGTSGTPKRVRFSREQSSRRSGHDNVL